MRGKYIPFSDDCGIVGYHYECPECEHVTLFTLSDEGCEDCGYNEGFVDPDEWYEKECKHACEYE